MQQLGDELGINQVAAKPPDVTPPEQELTELAPELIRELRRGRRKLLRLHSVHGITPQRYAYDVTTIGRPGRSDPLDRNGHPRGLVAFG